MSQAKISYFSLSGLQGKEAKLDWIAGTRFEEIKFENINPDGKGNWINQTHNDFDSFLQCRYAQSNNIRKLYGPNQSEPRTRKLNSHMI